MYNATKIWKKISKNRNYLFEFAIVLSYFFGAAQMLKTVNLRNELYYSSIYQINKEL